MDDSDDDEEDECEGWRCDCTGGCGLTDGDDCDCVSTFGMSCQAIPPPHVHGRKDSDNRGNFYTQPGTAEIAGILNLDALPAKMPLIECGPACPCDDRCLNRVTQRGLKYALLPELADDRVPIHVKPMNDDIGLGAYNDGDKVERGTFICLYAGEYLSTEEANARWSTINKKKGEGNYILTLRLPNQRIHIDPRYKGNVGRFFNHSCDPSCVVQVVRWGGDSTWPRAAIFVCPLMSMSSRSELSVRQRGILSKERN